MKKLNSAKSGLDHSTEAIVYFDQDGGLVSISESGLHSISGIPPCGRGNSSCETCKSRLESVCKGCLVQEVIDRKISLSKRIEIEDEHYRTLVCSPMFDSNGELTGAAVQFAIAESSESKVAELTHIRERLEAAIESAQLAWWEENFLTGVVLRSESWASMLGYEMEEIQSGKHAWLDLIHPDDQQKVLEAARMHESGQTDFFEVEHRMKTKDGSWRWILNWGRIVVRDDEGKPVRALGTHLDITRRKQAEIEKERLIEELQSALREIQTLKGIIPICAKCKKIRDDSGYWEQLEVFLKDHSMAEFSHSLCPDCAQDMYGLILPSEIESTDEGQK